MTIEFNMGNATSHAQRRRSARLQGQQGSQERSDNQPVQAAAAGDDDPEYVPEHMRMASESASDDEAYMTDEDDDDEESDDEELANHGRIFIPLMGGLRVARRSMSERNATLSKLERVPKDPPPAEENVRQIVSSATACENPRHRNEVDGKSKGGFSKRASTLGMLRHREANMLGGTACGMTSPQRCHLGAFVYQPAVPVHCIDTMHSRAYIGQFSGNGEVFIAAFQHDRRIRIYETENDWRLRKDVHARNLRWTVTDTCLSPDQKYLLYSSITPTVHMVNMSASGTVESEANVTDIHEALHFDILDEGSDDGFQRGFGIWSLSWAANGAEVVAGTGDDSLYLYNMERQKTTLRIRGHDDDVNAVTFLDNSSNLIASGSDDTLIKVWERRALRGNWPVGVLVRFCQGFCQVWDRRALRGNRPAGVLVGHTEGITHLDSRDDGRYLLSNCKDQTARLWDIRKMYTSNEHHRLPPPKIPKLGDWDYRWADFPALGYVVPHPHDVSVQTFRGHKVLQTLIRAYFSPAHSTGQRFVYTGSADGTAQIYDIVTGKVVRELRYHREIVRDLSWHPHLPMMVTSAFDGSVVQWDPLQSVDTETGQSVCTKRRRQLPEPGDDRLEDFY